MIARTQKNDRELPIFTLDKVIRNGRYYLFRYYFGVTIAPFHQAVLGVQLEWLKIFCDVVRWANVSRAALENGISQSSASQAIQQIEERLGVKLLDRSKRPIVATAAGRVYYEGCKELVGRYQEVENRVKALEDEQKVVGTVRVAAIYSVGLAGMNLHTERFEHEYPGATVKVEYLHPTRVVESILDDNCELGLISYPRKWPELNVIPWRDEEMVLAVSPTHPLASRGVIDVTELEGERFVAFDPELSIRRAIDRFFRQQSVHVKISIVFDNIENIKRAVEAHSGVSILPEPTMTREVEVGSLVVLRFRDHRLVRPIAIIHKRVHTLSLTASRFLNLLMRPECRSAVAAGAFSSMAP